MTMPQHSGERGTRHTEELGVNASVYIVAVNVELHAWNMNYNKIQITIRMFTNFKTAFM